MRPYSSLIALFLMSVPGWAGDVALVIGNADAGAKDAVPALEAAGFEVLSGTDLPASDVAGLVSQLSAKVDGTGRVVIALSGQFGQSASGNWFLGADADAPDLGAVSQQSIPVSTVLEIAARAPGGAVVALGQAPEAEVLGEGIASGIGALDIPQGVSVVTGSSADLASFLKDTLVVRGQSLPTAVAAWPNLTATGFVAPLISFLPAEGDVAPVVIETDPNEAEKTFWAVTQEINSQEAYDAYLARHPEGLFAREAKTRIEAIKAQPLLQAEADETALALSRDRRREIQRALTLLDYDPKGIDGIFGNGSRAAILKWQEINQEDGTGFVTLAQIERIKAQADRRSRELEEQARIRKEELERKDRAYWRASGEGGDEPGLRTYLERYPDGVFAEIALARLQPFEEARRAAAAEQDRADWDAAVSVGSLAAYEGYVQANPEGAFAEQARTQINELEFVAKNANALRAAERNEERLGLSTGTKRLVEDRLRSLELKPGAVDGVFDEDTRRAVRRYQEARNLPRTGYLNQQTLVRLLADSVLR